jgi:hypothetical protein
MNDLLTTITPSQFDNQTEFEIHLVDAIANEWERIEKGYANASLLFCYRLKQTLDENPDLNAKDLGKRLMEHPKVKNISTQRLWDNLRMLKRFPDVVEWQLFPEKREEVKEPILKKDGNLFEEFYRELSKYSFDNTTLNYLETKGKEESWSFRDLKGEINRVRDSNALELGEDKKLRSEAVRALISSLKDKPTRLIRKITEMVKSKEFDGI